MVSYTSTIKVKPTTENVNTSIKLMTLWRKIEIISCVLSRATNEINFTIFSRANILNFLAHLTSISSTFSSLDVARPVDCNCELSFRKETCRATFATCVLIWLICFLAVPRKAQTYRKIDWQSILRLMLLTLTMFLP